MVEHPSWLCPTPEHRERFLDMQERVSMARLVTIICGLVLMAAYLGRGGWPIPVFGSVMLAIVVFGGMHLERRRRPELWVFVTTVLNIQIWITIGTIVTGGPRTPLSSLLVAPVLMVGTRFSGRGLAVGAPLSGVLVLISTVAADPGFVARHPESAVVPLSLVVISAAYLMPVVASDVQHRVSSMLDELTGLLNRRALRERLSELTELARMNGGPVSAVALDIDRFKAINDEHGHAAGDHALQQIADTLRGTLRSFELLYRVGGDEFLLLLPGASAADATGIAEEMREALGRRRPLGTPISCSCGVATAVDEESLTRLLVDADAALYRAKRNGRDRVESDQPPAAAAAAA